MKVDQYESLYKEHLPVKYTQNIKYSFDSLGLNREVSLRGKNPLHSEAGF